MEYVPGGDVLLLSGLNGWNVRFIAGSGLVLMMDFFSLRLSKSFSTEKFKKGPLQKQKLKNNAVMLQAGSLLVDIIEFSYIS